MVPPVCPISSRAGASSTPGRSCVWSRMVGHGPIARVEFAIDGGWGCDLDRPIGDFAWRRWSLHWDATAGEHEPGCRAIDAAGDAQPADPPWNYQGMANNVVQRVPVTVA